MQTRAYNRAYKKTLACPSFIIYFSSRRQVMHFAVKGVSDYYGTSSVHNVTAEQGGRADKGGRAGIIKRHAAGKYIHFLDGREHMRGIYGGYER